MKYVVFALAIIFGHEGARRVYGHEFGELEDAITITLAECPKAVQKTLVREARGGKVASVDLGTIDLQVAFTAETVIDGRTYHIHVAANGRLISKSLADDDTADVVVALTACPPGVQKTLAREADGTAIKTVTKSTSEGRTLFTASVTQEEETYDISVTAEGLLLSKDVTEELDAEETLPAEAAPAAK